jgi:hypothetical protein
MSTAVLDRPRSAASAGRTVAAPRVQRGGETLDGLLSRAWDGLSAHRRVDCPLCGGRMAPRYGASGMAPVGGRCGDCGTTLG